MELHHSLHLRDQNQVFHQNPEEQKEQVSKNIKVELVKAKLQTVSLFLFFKLCGLTIHMKQTNSQNHDNKKQALIATMDYFTECISIENVRTWWK